jgi:hypothetical protein
VTRIGAEHLAEVGISGNHHQIVGRHVLQDDAVSRPTSPT